MSSNLHALPVRRAFSNIYSIGSRFACANLMYSFVFEFCSVVLSSTLGDVSINAHVMSCSTGDTNAPGVCIARPDSFGGHARTRLETLSTQQDPEPRPLGRGWQLPCATDLLREKGAQQKNNNTISTIYKLHRALSTQTKRIYLTGVFPFQNN